MRGIIHLRRNLHLDVFYIIRGARFAHLLFSSYDYQETVFFCRCIVTVSPHFNLLRFCESAAKKQYAGKDFYIKEKTIRKRTFHCLWFLPIDVKKRVCDVTCKAAEQFSYQSFSLYSFFPTDVQII